MNESLSVSRTADAKDHESTSPTHAIQPVREGPESDLNVLRKTVQRAKRNGSAPSGERITAELVGMPPLQRALALRGLQQTHGNRYVGRLAVQAKLRLGPAGDRYEQEADQVAQRVVETISSSDQGVVQRQEDEEDLEEEDVLTAQRQTIGAISSSGQDSVQRARGGGQPLSDGVRQPMERAFGSDFGGVRVHVDDQADWLNRSLQARAFTTGRDLFFRRGEFRPGSSEGQRLLAHELTHVVQQNGGAVQRAQMQATGRVLQAEEEAPPNRTGMPDHLKSGLETLSGMDLSGVRVHYNSFKPAQLNALAYTRGQEIHVAPGQEKHLPHEGWHAVQQMQGLVKPTLYARSVAINDDQGLEREADVMGAKSLEASSSLPARTVQKKYNKGPVAQLEPGGDGYSAEQHELLDLSNELQKNKSKITSVSENEIEEAIGGIMQIVQSCDESSISELLKKTRNVTENAEAGELESGTVQLAPWSKKGAVIGAILGTIVPVIGTIVGGIIGYKLGKKKDQINQLYADGATPVEVTAMLAVEPNAQTIHSYMTTVVPGFTLGNILFASVAGGNVGSIYFTNGRIRLTHGNQPQVSVHVGITRHTISNPDYGQYKTWLSNGRPGGGGRSAYIRGLRSFAPAVAGAGDRLVEFWPGHHHISRGGPVAFNYVLTQAQLNIICNVARLNDNNKLRAWMGAIPALAAIPIN